MCQQAASATDLTLPAAADAARVPVAAVAGAETQASVCTSAAVVAAAAAVDGDGGEFLNSSETIDAALVDVADGVLLGVAPGVVIEFVVSVTAPEHPAVLNPSVYWLLGEQQHH